MTASTLLLNDSVQNKKKVLFPVSTVEDFFKKPSFGQVDSLMITKVGVGRKVIKYSLDTDISKIRKIKKLNVILAANIEKAGLTRILDDLFAQVVVIDPKTDLSIDEIKDIRSSEYPENYIIGGNIDEKNRVVTLYRGDLTPMLLPFNFFKANALNSPNFEMFKVTDGGITLSFGEYETSIYNLLYTRDEEYRKKINKQRKKKDKTFGACLFRARKILGLKQDDFGMARATINRIENGETKTIHENTKQKILKKLSLSYDQLMNY